jgi:hypothetical protein
VLDYIREADGDLAQKIMDNMFTFDDLIKVDDKGFQALLKEVQSESLVMALKGASPEMREKVFKQHVQPRGRDAAEDLESRGPVRVSEVEAEQKEMLKIVRRLVDEGQIVLGRWLVRVTGLVLEAAGVRVPVGSVCECMATGQERGAGRGGGLQRRPRLPDAHRRAARPGQRRPRGAAPAAAAPPRWAATTTPGAAAKTAACTCPWATACWAAWSTHGQPMDRLGPLPMCATSRWCAAPSTRWTATRCARRWTPACAPSTPC